MDASRFATLKHYIDSLTEKVGAIQQAAEKSPSDQLMIEPVPTEVHLHLDESIELFDLYFSAADPREAARASG